MANTNVFEDLLLPDLPHSRFDLSHNVKLSTVIHRITPIFCEEVLPGDRWNITTKPFIRTQPLIAPIMDNCDVDVRYFFVPNRLIWDDWEDFVTGGKDGMAAPVMPHVKFGAGGFQSHSAYYNIVKPGSLWDYLGYPVPPSYVGQGDFQSWIIGTMSASFRERGINTLPIRAFHQIWNDYYQDRNLLVNPEERDFSKASGNEITLNNYAPGTPPFFLACPRVASLKDYFTSALPFAQRGNEVTVSLGGSQQLPVHNAFPYTTAGNEIAVSLTGSAGNYRMGFGIMPNGGQYQPGQATSVPAGSAQIGKVTVPAAPAISINQLRELTALQRYYETNARGGSRYVEQLLARWNVVSPDARMQRAEYLGGSRAPLMISEVMQQTPFEGSSGESPLGTLGGKAVSSDRATVEHYAYEHGWIIGLMYLRPQQTYSQGLHKKFTRMYNTDYYLPEFANLGEQEIKQFELLMTGSNRDMYNQENTFGYTPRYSEYKWLGNRLAGDFHDTLRFWTFAREFNELNSSLNSNFLRPQSTEFDDAFATNDGSDNILAQVNHHISVRRSMPMFPVPSLK